MLLVAHADMPQYEFPQNRRACLMNNFLRRTSKAVAFGEFTRFHGSIAYQFSSASPSAALKLAVTASRPLMFSNNRMSANMRWKR